MKKKLTLIIISILLLLSCDNVDNVEALNLEVSSFGIVGRWYTEIKEGEIYRDMYSECVFTASGAVYEDEYRRINGYKRHERQGTYKIFDDKIEFTIDSNVGFSNKNVYELICDNAFTFRIDSMKYNRIISIIALNVGDTLKLDAQQIIDSYTLQSIKVISYTITDEAIVSIDDAGLMIAKLIGVTFLKIETSEGTAVLKVAVSDKNNNWNDFSQGLGKDFDEVELLFGKHYAYKSDSMRYFCDNYYVNSVDIYRHGNIADSIVVSFHKEVTTENDVVNYLERNNVYVTDSISFAHYTDHKNYLLSTYSVKFYKEDKKLIYTRCVPNWDDRTNDFGLSYENLRNKYGRPRRENKGSGQITYSNIQNDFVTEITYWYKPNVYQYVIRVSIDVSQSMIEDYLSRNYLYWNSLRPYAKNVLIDGKEMIVWVSVNKQEHCLYYYFENNY